MRKEDKIFVAKIARLVPNCKGKSWPMIVLENVRFQDGVEFRDHVWIDYTKRFADFKINDVIEFSASIYDYISSYGSNKGLDHLRNLKKIGVFYEK